jgi:hypothetical protein
MIARAQLSNAHGVTAERATLSAVAAQRFKQLQQAYIEERQSAQRYLQLQRVQLPSLVRLPVTPLVSVLTKRACVCSMCLGM